MEVGACVGAGDAGGGRAPFVCMCGRVLWVPGGGCGGG